MAGKLDLRRQSRTGLNVWSGTVDEEWLRDLRGAKGVKVYREMADNDPTVGSLLFVFRMMLRGVDWFVTEGDEDSEELSDSGEHIKSCMDDMGSMTWDDFIDEAASFLEYGWAANEILWKMRKGPDQKDPKFRSAYTDGRIGWRGLPIIGQETLDNWQWDEDGQLEGMFQTAGRMGDTGSASMETGGRPFIPRMKFVHCRTSKRKGNPEGRSILRNAYRPWYFKKHIEMFEGIGIERDLAGYPVMTAPADIFMDHPPPEYEGIRDMLETALQEVKRDEREGLLMPNEEAGYTFKLVSSSGARQFDTGKVITRKDKEILSSVLADFIAIGHEQVGSFALSITKVGMFVGAVNSFLVIMSESIQKDLVIPTLEINGMMPADPKDVPKIVASKVSARDVAEKVEVLVKLQQAGQMPNAPVMELTNAILLDYDLPAIDAAAFKEKPATVGGKFGEIEGDF